MMSVVYHIIKPGMWEIVCQLVVVQGERAPEIVKKKNTRNTTVWNPPLPQQEPSTVVNPTR